MHHREQQHGADRESLIAFGALQTRHLDELEKTLRQRALAVPPVSMTPLGRRYL
jgi:hypothetical protein